jgi:short-subunit dehydrogenase
VETRAIAADLSDRAHLDRIVNEICDLDLGLLVYNAGQSFIGPFWETSVEDHLKEIDVNVRGPLVLAHAIGGRLRARGRGGIVLMSSLAGFQGTALVANYAATKAFNLVLGEGLWDELRGAGVDAMVCCAGATSTPNYRKSAPSAKGSGMVPVQTPGQVAREALDYLGRGPLRITGRANRLASLLLRRVLPRKLAVQIMGQNTRKMYG